MSKKTILIIIIILLAGAGYGVYVYMYKNNAGDDVTRQVVDGQGAQASSAAVNTLQDGPGKEFVTQLLAIQNIKFNLSIFADPVFLGLVDESRTIQEQPIGRPNPFAPIDDSARSGSPSTITEALGNISGDPVINSIAASSSASSARATTTTRVPAR